jgi:ribosomal protein L23
MNMAAVILLLFSVTPDEIPLLNVNGKKKERERERGRDDGKNKNKKEKAKVAKNQSNTTPTPPRFLSSGKFLSLTPPGIGEVR